MNGAGDDVGRDAGPEPELGRGSLWFLRGVSVVFVAVVLWFLFDAVIG